MPQASAAVASKIAAIATGAVQAVASRTDNDLSAAAVSAAKPEISAEINRAVATAPALDNLAVVGIKSPWASKINWGAVISAAAAVAAMFGFNLDPDTQKNILAGIVGVTTVYTLVMKTFFTDTVSSASMPAK